MIIATHHSMMQASGPRLPYDAEVEYLQSTGTQAILINHPVNKDTDKVYCRYAKTNLQTIYAWALSLRYDVSTISVIPGGLHHQRNNDTLSRQHCGDNTNGFSNWITGNTTVQFRLYTLTVDFSSCNVTFWDGVTKKQSSIDTIWAPHNGIGLFGIPTKNLSGWYERFSCKIYEWKMWRNGTLIHDLVPVRKGGVGYKYDRAAPRGGPLGNGLYPNAGTGAFVIGTDKQETST